jgi:hypothetical protein
MELNFSEQVSFSLIWNNCLVFNQSNLVIQKKCLHQDRLHKLKSCIYSYKDVYSIDRADVIR